jgi:hypothetical protein
MAAEHEFQTEEDPVFAVIEPKKVALKWGFLSITTQFAASVCMEMANTLASASMMITQRFLYENEQAAWAASAGREIEALQGFYLVPDQTESLDEVDDEVEGQA